MAASNDSDKLSRKFTCSKSIAETLAKDAKMFKVKNKENQDHVNDVILVFLLLTLNIDFTPFSSVQTVDFELINVCWEETFSLRIQYYGK